MLGKALPLELCPQPLFCFLVFLILFLRQDLLTFAWVGLELLIPATTSRVAEIIDVCHNSCLEEQFFKQKLGLFWTELGKISGAEVEKGECVLAEKGDIWQALRPKTGERIVSARQWVMMKECPEL
jgi:hypothetical protein